MNKKSIILCLAMMFLPFFASARDFMVGGIYYNITSEADKTVEVTSSDGTEYSGSITIPATVTHNGVEYSVTSIGRYAFYNCSSLAAITIPESMTSIGSSAFYNCSNLKTVINYSDLPLQRGYSNYGYVAGYADRVIYLDEVIDGYAFKTIEGVNYLTGYIGDKTELTLPTDYKGANYQIGERAFYKCSSLTAINIPESVTSIGSGAFEDCSSLKTVINYSDLPLQRGSNDYGNVAYYADRVIYLDEVIDGYAFKTTDGVHYLTGYIGDDTALTLPTDYKGANYQIGERAFYKCSSLTAINIPESVTSIGYRAFSSCSSLTAINIPEGVTSIGDYAFEDCSSLERVTFNCANVGSWFSGLSSIKEIVLGEGVTNIGSYAFYKCYSLTSITIPEDSKLTSIGYYAFRSCSSLTAITIPESMTSIGECAFYGCSSLTAITIPKGVTSIGEYAFAWCGRLTTINIPEDSKLTSIEKSVFSSGSLTTITIPESVTSIEDRAFYACNSLTTINIPEDSKLTSIGDEAFDYCSSLTSIVLPKSVAFISSEAFADCSGLTDVYCYAETVPSTNTDAFGSYINCATLYVPTIAMNDYKNTAPWSGFGRVKTLEALVENITLNVSTATLIEGEDLTLTVMVTPDDAADKSISWSSSNTAVASVDANGKVTAIVPGTATITTTANDGSGVSAQCEVTVIPASYVITFLVDGEVILTDTLTRGSTINLPDVPEKEGHTFSGWSEVPETMPAKDVTVSGTFIVNKYLVTFKIDDEVIAADSLEYGATIVVPEAPAKEGYTFSGWSEVPETMPAKDVTVSGTFTINKYLVTFKIGDEVIAADSLEYGAAIVVPEAPAKEGYTFSGWSEVPETMPANDVTIEGTFTQLQSIFLTINQADNGYVKQHLTEGTVCTFTIVAAEGWTIHSVTFNGEEVTDQLTEEGTFTTPALQADAVLNIAYEKTEDNTMVANTTARAIKVQGHQGTLRITGTTEGEAISVYTTGGTLVAQESAEGDETLITIPTGQVYIVTVADKVVKIGM